MITERKVYFDVVADKCLTVDRIDENTNEVYVSYDDGKTYVFGFNQMEKAILNGILIQMKGMYE